MSVIKTCKESLADYVGFVDKKRLNVNKSRIRFAEAANKTFLPSLNFTKQGFFLKVGAANNLTRFPPSERLEQARNNQIKSKLLHCIKRAFIERIITRLLELRFRKFTMTDTN